MVSDRELSRVSMREIERYIARKAWVELNQWLTTVETGTLPSLVYSSILRSTSRVRSKLPAYDLVYTQILRYEDPNDPLWVGFTTDTPPRFKTYSEFNHG